MELLLANHSSYPRIGDDAEHQVLRRTIAQWEKKEKTDGDLKAAENQMTEFALREQLDAGLDIVTDGQIRWYDPVSHVAGKLDGVRINGLLRLFDTNFYFRQPIVTGPIRRREAILAEDFRFAQKNSSRPVKVVLTGPYTLTRLSAVEGNHSGGMNGLLDGFTAALAEEVAALAAAGASIIQVDEPSLLRQPGDFPLAARSFKALAAGKGGAQIHATFYFGDAAPLYEKLQTLDVDALALDFTYSPRLAEVIAAAGSSKPLSLGLVDGRNTKLEDASVVARQIERLANRIGAARAILQPSCGLEYLPRDRARLKLKRLAAIKNSLLGKSA